MANTGLQILGLAICIVGMIGTIVCCSLPMWKVSAFIGSSIVTAQNIWEGLWMNCVVQSTGQMQCKMYDSMLSSGQDLQTARAFTVIAIVLSILAVLVSTAGAKCTTCVEDEVTKSRIMIAAGVVFILAGILELVPVSWVANQIVWDFHDPMITSSMKCEIGASMYIGWAASALLILGGSLLSCSCPPKCNEYEGPHSAHTARSNYV
uniref:claudin-4-like n=1 Tax=Myxine glutinosa TaxID=7769 RepID=UPI00358E82D8